MTALTESWFEPVVEPTTPRPRRPVTDELDGETPTWRMDEEPIYLECVRDLGVPGSLLGPAPGDVVAGELADPDDDSDMDDVDVDEEYPRDATSSGPLTLVHTQPLPVVDEPAPRRQPTRKPRAARKRTAS